MKLYQNLFNKIYYVTKYNFCITGVNNQSFNTRLWKLAMMIQERFVISKSTIGEFL